MIFLLIIAGVFLLDYKVKSYIETNKTEGKEENAMGGGILIRRHSNSGAACSLLKNRPEIVRWTSGILFSVMSILFIKELFQKGNTGLKLGGSMILGGGLSNLYDRLKKGAVTDYFSFDIPIKRIRNLIFNISDMFILFGTIISFIQLCREK